MASLPAGPFAYIDEGRGPAYVLVHGLPGSARDFRWLAPALSARGRVVRLDMPGFGDTPAATAPGLDVSARARFVRDAMDTLELERPVLVGHSMGGLVATALAAETPERLAGLGLIASPGLRVHRALRQGPLRTIGGVLGWGPARRILRTRVRRSFTASGFRHARDDELVRTMQLLRATSMAEHVTRLAAVRRAALPTLHAFSEDDPMIEVAIMADTAEALGGETLRFDGGGHNPQKHHAVEIADALVRWRTPSAT